MLLGVLSDTHGNIPVVLQAVKLFRSLGAERLIHCGDIGTTSVVRALEGFTVDYVFGNCDYDLAQLGQAIADNGQTCHEWFGEITIGTTRIAVTHGHLMEKMRDAIQSDKYDLLCYGHTHVAEQHFSDRTLVLNPGALYRAEPYQITLVELPDLVATPYVVPRS